MKAFMIAAAALTLFAAPPALAQSHGYQGGGYGGGHGAPRHGGNGYVYGYQGFNNGHGFNRGWAAPRNHGYAFNDFRPRREHYVRRGHGRVGGHNRGW